MGAGVFASPSQEEASWGGGIYRSTVSCPGVLYHSLGCCRIQPEASNGCYQRRRDTSCCASVGGGQSEEAQFSRRFEKRSKTRRMLMRFAPFFGSTTKASAIQTSRRDGRFPSLATKRGIFPLECPSARLTPGGARSTHKAKLFLVATAHREHINTNAPSELHEPLVRAVAAASLPPRNIAL